MKIVLNWRKLQNLQNKIVNLRSIQMIVRTKIYRVLIRRLNLFRMMHQQRHSLMRRLYLQRRFQVMMKTLKSKSKFQLQSCQRMKHTYWRRISLLSSIKLGLALKKSFTVRKIRQQYQRKISLKLWNFPRSSIRVKI